MDFIIYTIIFIIIGMILYRNKIIQGMIEELKYPFSNDPEGRYKKGISQRRARRSATRTIFLFIEFFLLFIIAVCCSIYSHFDNSKEIAKEIEGIYSCTDEKGNSEILYLTTSCYFSSTEDEQCTWRVEKGVVKISYYDGNKYDGYKKREEYIATIKDNELHVKGKICKKIK